MDITDFIGDKIIYFGANGLIFSDLIKVWWLSLRTYKRNIKLRYYSLSP